MDIISPSEGGGAGSIPAGTAIKMTFLIEIDLFLGKGIPWDKTPRDRSGF